MQLTVRLLLGSKEPKQKEEILDALYAHSESSIWIYLALNLKFFPQKKLNWKKNALLPNINKNFMRRKLQLLLN